GDVADLDDGAKDQRDSEPQRERDECGEQDLGPNELAEADEPTREAADDVLVPFGRERAGRKHEREKGDRQSKGVGLDVGRERPASPSTLYACDLDRMRRRPQRIAGACERELRVTDEVAQLPRLRAG